MVKRSKPYASCERFEKIYEVIHSRKPTTQETNYLNKHIEVCKKYDHSKAGVLNRINIDVLMARARAGTLTLESWL